MVVDVASDDLMIDEMLLDDDAHGPHGSSCPLYPERVYGPWTRALFHRLSIHHQTNTTMPTPIQASLSPIVPSPVHKRPWKQPKPIQTLVQPIPPALARLGEKPSTSRAALIAYAPRSLMTQLSKFTQANNGPNTSTRVPVAVTWSRERRLCQHGVKGKGKNVEESLIIWVETLPEEVSCGITRIGENSCV